jgi:hypothetical protein
VGVAGAIRLTPVSPHTNVDGNFHGLQQIHVEQTDPWQSELESDMICSCSYMVYIYTRQIQELRLNAIQELEVCMIAIV